MAYRINYTQLEPNKRVVKIRDEPEYTGVQRILERQDQQSHLCLKAVKGFNYPTQHVNSQARRLAQVNKKLMEMEEIASQSKTEDILVRSPTQKSALNGQQEQLQSKRSEPLDMHHLYIKEMREPSYVELPRNLSPAKPCENFNRSYLPNGKPIAFKQFKDQHREISKLHIDDWKRASYPYETAFEGEQYHLIRDRQ